MERPENLKLAGPARRDWRRYSVVHKITWPLRKARRLAFRARLFVPGLRERHILESMVGPVGAWDELQAYQLRVLQANGLRPEHRLLDIGCGPLQGGVAFIGYLAPGHYVGVDRSTRNLAAAYR
ncbi:MAG TPA: hypothetical protein VNO52_09560, partial [Methylomirabilota bacterium]|nr:hypothetical protein [Methylomirabilota bacterium]